MALSCGFHDINERNSNGDTLPSKAKACHDSQLVPLLIKAGANAQDTTDGSLVIFEPYDSVW